VHDVLALPGQPLDQETRNYFEPRFGHDFSKVRVHADEKAAESAGAVDALAYTVGQNIVFGARQYRPRAEQGVRLLAHELTHVVQQGNWAHDSSGGRDDLRVGAISDPLESEAEKVSTGLAFHVRAQPANGPAALQRLPREGDPDHGSTLPRRQAMALTDCLNTMGEKNREYCLQQVMSASPRQLQPGMPAATGAAGNTAGAPSNTVKAGETGCEMRTGQVKIEIDRNEHPQCMWDCVEAHENVHAKDQGQKCQDLFKLYTVAKAAGEKADRTHAPEDKQAADDAFKKLTEAITAYENWFASGCKDREKNAYKAGLDKCSTPADRCKDNKAEFDRIMADWRRWAQNPPPTTKCP
jgi:hypothetical protein